MQKVEIMPEQTARTLNHFSTFAFTDAYWSQDSKSRVAFHQDWLAGLRSAAHGVDVYQHTDSAADLLVWCARSADGPAEAADFFTQMACASAPHRHLIRQLDSLWGFTRP